MRAAASRAGKIYRVTFTRDDRASARPARHTSCSLVMSFDERTRKEAIFMNQDILTGKWKQMRGQVKQWWGKLTDDDLDRIDGAMDKLAGSLQERYGWERDQAEREMKKRFDRYDEELRDPARR